MIQRQVSLPTIGLIAGTRVALGIGIGLLLANRLSPEQRRAAGLALFAVGALTTVPLIAQVLGGCGEAKAAELNGPAESAGAGVTTGPRGALP